jgi:hypothetical protein
MTPRRVAADAGDAKLTEKAEMLRQRIRIVGHG